MSKKPPSGRKPTPKEAQLWAQVMQDVAPLKDHSPPNKEEQESEAQTIPTPEKRGRKRATVTAQPHKEPQQVVTNEPHHQSSQQMDANRLRKMKRGKLPIEATLDLHGYNQADAHAALNRFIEQAIRSKKRCVMVITGKGDRNYSSADPDEFGRASKGVLRRNLPLWLEQEPIKSMVLNMETAKQHHGGSGAYYIYLRKAKDRRAFTTRTPQR